MVALQYGSEVQLRVSETPTTVLTCHIAAWQPSTFPTVSGIVESVGIEDLICVDESGEETWVGQALGVTPPCSCTAARTRCAVLYIKGARGE